MLKPYCPPYFASMGEAVDAVVQLKFGRSGAYREEWEFNGWKEGGAVRGAVPALSDAAIAATKAYCQYLWNRYGRFPVHLAPYRTVLGFQASHLDVQFYERFYRPDAIHSRQTEDFRPGSAERAPGT